MTLKAIARMKNSYLLTKKQLFKSKTKTTIIAKNKTFFIEEACQTKSTPLL